VIGDIFVLRASKPTNTIEWVKDEIIGEPPLPEV
jgi:hypothetical protein